MSSLIVKVVTLDEIKPHNNADSLEIAIVGGWQCVVQKNRYLAGDKIVYIPPDTVLPGYVSDGIGVTNYLSKGRVRSVKLRGEPSFGLVVSAKEEWGIDQDVAHYFGAYKYEPPQKISAGDAAAEHTGFPKYTDIENLRHFPDLFEQNEMVWVTEKIHGTNCRVGMVDGFRMAGSHRVRRKEPEEGNVSVYWQPWLLDSVRSCLEDLSLTHKQVIIYGEVYGPQIQNLTYGVEKPQFAVFDIKIGGRYMDVAELQECSNRYGLSLVPSYGVYPYSLDTIKQFAIGKSVLADHIREGVVIRPLTERTNPKVGRVIAKYVNDEYLVNQDKYSDYTDLVRLS